MISLQERTLADMLERMNERKSKFPIILDDEEITGIIKKSVRKLNDLMFNPRTALIESPGTWYDTTDMNIDEICRVVFPPLAEVNFMFSELGIIPFISQQGRMTTLEGITDYLGLKGVLNMMNRQMELDGDWEYYPTHDPPSIQFRRAYDLVMVEYLPYLDPEASPAAWQMYENEYSYVLERSWVNMNLRNAEAAISAQYLGVGAEMMNVLQYWKTKMDELDKEFKESTIITYLV